MQLDELSVVYAIELKNKLTGFCSLLYEIYFVTLWHQFFLLF